MPTRVPGSTGAVTAAGESLAEPGAGVASVSQPSRDERSARTRGDWAAANGQLRTILESLFDDIARNVRPAEGAQLPTSENPRALLAEIGFLATDRNEWTQDGKNYINGVFKMLHTEGSHPGLSDEDHSTFRLHLVLITTRTFLRRLRFGR